VLIPGSKVAFASGRGTYWGARSIIQEKGCGKNGRNRCFPAFKNAQFRVKCDAGYSSTIGLSAETSALVLITRRRGTLTPVFLFAGSFDDLINAFRTEFVGCFLNGLFTDDPQNLREGVARRTEC
jgi:hypothetical protein